MDLTVSAEDIAELAGRLQVAVDDAYQKGVQTERERIRARVFAAATKTWSAGELYIGPPHWNLQQFVDALLEDDDASL